MKLPPYASLAARAPVTLSHAQAHAHRGGAYAGATRSCAAHVQTCGVTSEPATPPSCPSRRSACTARIPQRACVITHDVDAEKRDRSAHLRVTVRTKLELIHHGVAARTNPRARYANPRTRTHVHLHDPFAPSANTVCFARSSMPRANDPLRDPSFAMPTSLLWRPVNTRARTRAQTYTPTRTTTRGAPRALARTSQRYRQQLRSRCKPPPTPACRGKYQRRAPPPRYPHNRAQHQLPAATRCPRRPPRAPASPATASAERAI